VAVTREQSRSTGRGATLLAADPPVVVKLGGSALEDAASALDAVATLWHAGWQPTLVHGGGPQIDAFLRALGITPRFHDGRRVTDAATLDVVRAVMAGQINTELVRQLVARGIPAVGLSGLDGAMLPATRAAPELGLVGLPQAANVALVRTLLTAGYVPVITSLGLGPDGECLNINADDAATSIACALDARHLAFISDVAGVQNAEGGIMPRLTPPLAEKLLQDGIITGGMVPKVEACLAALASVGAVHILDAVGSHDLPAIFAGAQTAGTRIEQ
jgi:acetylglutamate kinase